MASRSPSSPDPLFQVQVFWTFFPGLLFSHIHLHLNLPPGYVPFKGTHEGEPAADIIAG